MRRVVCAVVLVVSGLLAAPAAADETFTVSGMVRGDGQKPLSGATVDVATSQDVTRSVTTDGQGRWAMTVPRGTYGVAVVSAGYVRRDFYVGTKPEKGKSTPVEVVDGDVLHVDVQMARLAMVKGRILLRGKPPKQSVFAHFRPAVSGESAGDYVQPDGRFSFAVMPGTYDFDADADLAGDERASLARRVKVGSGAVVDLGDLALDRRPRGKIVATVVRGSSAGRRAKSASLGHGAYVDGQNGSISPIVVGAYRHSVNYPDRAADPGEGVAVIDGVTPGTYRLGKGAWWFGGRSYFSARPIVVKADQTSKVEVQALDNPGLTGYVRNSRGYGIPNITVKIYRPGDLTEELAVTATWDGGFIEVPELPAGSYRLRLSDPSGSYKPRWVDLDSDDPGVGIRSVTMAHRTSLSPADADQSASLVVRSTRQYDWELYPVDDGIVPAPMTEENSDDQGLVRKRVAPGAYKVRLGPSSWLGGRSFSTARTVTLVAGGQDTVDAGTRLAYGALVGYVRGSDGIEPQSAVVTIVAADDGEVVRRIRVVEGSWRTDRLPVRPYRIRVDDEAGRYASRWLGGARDFDTGVTVVPRPYDELDLGTSNLPLVFVAVTAPTVKGNAVVGRVLTATSGTFTKSYSWAARRWLRDGKPIKGATRTTYRLTTGDAGHRITYALAVRRKGGDPTARSTSIPTAVIARR